MIPALVFVGLVAWILLQTRQSRAFVWSLRFQRWSLYLAPIVRNVIADVRAVRYEVRAWRFQRKLNRR